MPVISFGAISGWLLSSYGFTTSFEAQEILKSDVQLKWWPLPSTILSFRLQVSFFFFLFTKKQTWFVFGKNIMSGLFSNGTIEARRSSVKTKRCLWPQRNSHRLTFNISRLSSEISGQKHIHPSKFFPLLLVQFSAKKKSFIHSSFLLQEFKNATREDTLDYTIYSANVKRKRPTPRKSSRSAKKAVAYNDDDDDEDDDDRGWNGGGGRGRGGGGVSARRLNYSTRSSNRR